jgi:hypothetical protein
MLACFIAKPAPVLRLTTLQAPRLAPDESSLVSAAPRDSFTCLRLQTGGPVSPAGSTPPWRRPECRYLEATEPTIVPEADARTTRKSRIGRRRRGCFANQQTQQRRRRVSDDTRKQQVFARSSKPSCKLHRIVLSDVFVKMARDQPLAQIPASVPAATHPRHSWQISRFQTAWAINSARWPW